MLRRIARRAIRHGYKLGARKPFFHSLLPALVAAMGDAYPELRRDERRIADVLKQEEERFFLTIANGMEILESALRALEPGRALDGELAFKLHDTYGFPLDLTADVCRERGVTVDTRRLRHRHGAPARPGARGGQVPHAAGPRVRRRRDHLPRLRAARPRVGDGHGGVRGRHCGRARRGRRRCGGGARPHAVLRRVGRPGRRHRRAAQRQLALRRRGHAEGAGRRVRPSRPRARGPRRRRRRADGAGRRGASRAGRCATIRRRT